MPKPRLARNKALPARWRYKHGAYYYRVPSESSELWDGKTEFRLGKTLHEAYRTWADRIEQLDGARTMSQLLDRYAREVVPKKAPKSQESNLLSIRRLRPVFEEMPIFTIQPRHAYRYRDRVTKKHGPSSANRDLEVLSHSLSKAVEWGLIDRNALKGQVRKNAIIRRERYIEDWELAEALKVASPMLRSYIVLKLLTGLRRGDLLKLRVSSLTDFSICVETSKTSTKLTIRWTAELSAAVESALSARQCDSSPWIFSTNQGACYVKENGKANGFDSLWQRFMQKALNNTGLTEKFQEKDLRKKTATDMPIELATRLLGHSSAQTTRRHYRLKGDLVDPHSLKNA